MRLHKMSDITTSQYFYTGEENRMEKYEALELQVISFEVDDVLATQGAAVGGGSVQTLTITGGNNIPVNP